MTKSKKQREGIIPKGRPKSGRVWKSDKRRCSSIKQDRPLKTSWNMKMKAKQEMKNVKQQDRALKEAMKQAREDKKKRRAENIRRREENAKKSEVVQVISNTAKLKRLTKKQMRTVQKR